MMAVANSDVLERSKQTKFSKLYDRMLADWSSSKAVTVSPAVEPELPMANPSGARLCEECGSTHDGTYGSGRFCSEVCRFAFGGKTAALVRKGMHVDGSQEIDPSTDVPTLELLEMTRSGKLSQQQIQHQHTTSHLVSYPDIKEPQKPLAEKHASPRKAAVLNFNPDGSLSIPADLKEKLGESSAYISFAGFPARW